MTERGRSWVRAAAVVVPFVVAWLAGLLADVLANTDAALVLVLVVVAAAALGDRLAGVLAALASAAAFDFFLTVPVHSFAILDREDVETAVLLLAIGLAVSEIASWGRRQQAASGQRADYLDGVARAARLAAEGRPGREVGETIAAMITEVLDLDACRFDAFAVPGAEPDRPVLHRDGSISRRGHVLDVRHDGLPGMDVIELAAGHDGGCFLLTASTEVRRPTVEQLLVAVTLAEQLPTTRRTAF
ncbi:DUF4118 domain-containing protein [Actinomycetospora chiangmaiensis]|uniref:DUF4118 domain-containing protein n=1 Tax=Actinomycetospora chiangmaiensis TaxID=402650 RepID=UPI00036E01EF|nr:DUF4118 domain-containing protein [Actinomycetospora chiangmaiensis]